MAWTAWSAASSQPNAEIPRYTSSKLGGPNIYLVVLDAYPREDTLREVFGMDNNDFVAGLNGLGFEVSDGAHSNYTRTWLTMASMFNGTYVQDMIDGEEIPADDPSQVRWLQALINRGALLDLFRAAGYVIRTVPPPITSSALTSADDYVDGGHLTELEATILWSSPWAVVFRDVVAPMFVAEHERTVLDALSTTAALAESGDASQQFVYSHIQSPHPPFALHLAGTPPPPPIACFPVSCTLWQSTIGESTISMDEYRQRLDQQLRSLNTAVLQAVRRITTADPSAIVILMSDHGLRYSVDDAGEHFKSFFAARTPSRTHVFAEDVSPVNVLRRVAQVFLGAATPPLPYRSWQSSQDATLDLTPVPWMSP